MWWKTALSWTWRLLLLVPVLLVAAAWLALEGVGGETWGWFRVAGVLVPLAAVLAVALFRRWWPAAGAVVLALGLATLLWQAAPVMPSRLRAELAGVDVPGELVAERDSGFDPFFGTDPSVDRTYRADRPVDVPALAAAFAADGWATRYDERWRQVWATRGEIEAFAQVDGRTIDLSVSVR